jgi:uncharacterized membrane protein YfcA
LGPSIALLIVLGALAGFGIGVIGIGGILLVSGLIYIGGMPPAEAIAISMFGYILTGTIGTLVYARRKSIAWPMAGWLSAGALPAAFLGSWMSNVAAPSVLELAIALLTLSSGVQALWGRAKSADEAATFGAVHLTVIGAFSGCGSAMTGTGGPLILVPTLLWLGVPALTAIGLSQAIQIPIGLLATAGNAMYGSLDLVRAAVVAVTLAVASYGGATMAHYLPREVLRKTVAQVLVIVGAMITLKVAIRALQ